MVSKQHCFLLKIFKSYSYFLLIIGLLMLGFINNAINIPQPLTVLHANKIKLISAIFFRKYCNLISNLLFLLVNTF